VRRIIHAGAAVAVLLASQAGDASCQDTGTGDASRAAAYECHVDTRGLRNESGTVTDVLSHWCDPTPLHQKFMAWIEARVTHAEDGMPPWERSAWYGPRTATAAT
jgi:hypothetical protein